MFIKTGGSDSSKDQRSKPPPDNKNYLPFALIGAIYVLYLMKSGDKHESYMSYKVDFAYRVLRRASQGRQNQSHPDQMPRGKWHQAFRGSRHY